MSELSVSRPGWRARAVPLRLRSDDRLARDAAGGESAAFAALYERHHQPLYRYCRSIVADPHDAADALQSTMTRAWAAIGDRDPAAPVRAWLFRIAHNESVSLLRRRTATEPLDPETLVGPDVAADAESRRRLADLVRDLQGLSERQRGALLMREVSGLGHAEIAAALEASEGAVKQSIYEARIALQDLAMGREMSCSAVRRELSDGDGRTARARRLRGHLRSCEDCRRFRDALQTRRSELALIAPVLPAATAAAVLEAVIGAGGAGGGGLLASLLGGSAAKTVAVGAAAVTAGAGAATYTVVAPDGERRAPRVAETVKRDAAEKIAKRARTVPVVAEPLAGDRDDAATTPASGDRGTTRAAAMAKMTGAGRLPRRASTRTTLTSAARRGASPRRTTATRMRRTRPARTRTKMNRKTRTRTRSPPARAAGTTRSSPSIARCRRRSRPRSATRLPSRTKTPARTDQAARPGSTAEEPQRSSDARRDEPRVGGEVRAVGRAPRPGAARPAR